MADKHALSLFLSRRPDRWLPPAEIKAELAGVPDRTLRRWLGELVKEGIAERSGDRKGTRYRWRASSTSRPTSLETEKPVTRAGSAAAVPSIFSPASEQSLQRIEAPL